MSARLLIGLVVAAVVLSAVPAGAQWMDTQTAQKWTVAAGIFRPQESQLRDDLGNAWLDIRLGYMVPSNLKGTESCIETGLIYKKHSGLKNQAIPLTWNFMVKPAGDSKVFYGAGLGVFFLKRDDGTSSDSWTKLGIPIILGVNLSEKLDLQLRYNWIPSEIDNTNRSGFSLLVGTKF